MNEALKNEFQSMSLEQIKAFEAEFKAYAKARKAELKAELAASKKELVVEGSLVEVRAPATWDVETVIGTVKRVGEKSFTVAIDRGTDKPKNLVRTYDAFIGLADATDMSVTDYEATEEIQDEAQVV